MAAWRGWEGMCWMRVDTRRSEGEEVKKERKLEERVQTKVKEEGEN